MSEAPNPVRKVIFLARKLASVQALEFLLSHDVTVAAIVTNPTEPACQPLQEMAEKNKIPFFTDDVPLYQMIADKAESLQDVDLVISYLFWKRIKNPLLKLGKARCINFHPAPLPDYKSRAGYNTAILDGRTSYGVSAHFIESEEFDNGPIIEVINFPMSPETELAVTLEKTAQTVMLELFKRVMTLFIEGKEIPTSPNNGGLYLTAKELEKLKQIWPEKDSDQVIDRKIRAFFFPPHTGAFVEAGGKRFEVVNQAVLDYLASLKK